MMQGRRHIHVDTEVSSGYLEQAAPFFLLVTLSPTCKYHGGTRTTRLFIMLVPLII